MNTTCCFWNTRHNANTFNFEKSSNNISVWFDAKQMQKAINNLISNAFKYTKAGGTISIAVRKRNQEVLIEITDNGSGIAEKDIVRSSIVFIKQT